MSGLPMLIAGLAAVLAPPVSPGSVPDGAASRPSAAPAPLARLAVPAFQDEVRVRATLRTEEIRVGETAVLEVLVETDGPAVDGIELPPLPAGLTLSGSRDYSQLQFNLPGGRSRSLRREFFITGSASGSYRIPSLTVRVRGAVYTTPPLQLHVLPAATASHVATVGDRFVELRAFVEPAETVYVGQQATYWLEAVYSEPAQIRSHRTLRYGLPRPAGFWLHEMPDRDLPETRIVDGRAVEVRRADIALFPIEPGSFEIPPGRLRYDVRRGFLQPAETREIATDPVRLVVLPLPSADRPADFDGAVGRYRIDARLEPSRVPAGEAAVLRVDVRGSGNVRALPPPRIPELPGLEAYAPAEDIEVAVRDGVVVGTKSFSWVLVPGRAGEFELPRIEYPYFDPESGEYGVASAAPLRLSAYAGAVSGDDAVVRLRALKPRPATSPLRWVTSPAFLLLQTVPLAALAWVVLAGRVGQRRGRGRQRPLVRLRTSLDRVRRRAVSEPRAAVDELARVVPAWLADRLGSSGLRLDDMRQRLVDGGVAPDDAESLVSLLHRLDRVRFAPAGPTAPGVATLVRETAAILESIDAALDRPDSAMPSSGSATGAGTAGALVAALLLAGCAFAGGSSGDAQRAFAMAVGAYEAGDHAAALDGFRDVVRTRPDDRNGWYNLGNVHYALGQRGHAVWAWATAADLDPRDRDVRENLRMAAPAEAPAPLLAGLPITRHEALLVLAIGWWLGVGGAVLYLRSGRRNRLHGGLAAFAIGVVVFLAWAVPRAGYPGAIVLEPDSPVHVAPASQADVLVRVPAGAAVRVVEVRGEWVRVRAPGTDGWMPAADVGRL